MFILLGDTANGKCKGRSKLKVFVEKAKAIELQGLVLWMVP